LRPYRRDVGNGEFPDLSIGTHGFKLIPRIQAAYLAWLAPIDFDEEGWQKSKLAIATLN
jgi:hypothetical protein